MRLKLVCIGIAVLIAAIIMCSCVANPEITKHYESDYEITRVGSSEYGAIGIYKVKTPEKTYTIFCNYKSGSVILN